MTTITEDRATIRGMGLFGAIVLIAMMAILLGISAPIADQVFVSQGTMRARSDLESIKTAITGNPNLIITEGRADFGFIGTVGDVPDQLSKLWLKGSFPLFSFDTNTLVGAGWVGPYVPKTTVERLIGFDKDPFGNAYVYTSTTFNRSGDNAEVAARLQSVGPDGIKGNSDDLIVDILKDEVFSQVTGVAKRKKKVLKFATVTLNIPEDGAVTQRFDVTDGSGNFDFDDVSFGFRSLSIDAKLTYEEGTAKIKGGNDLQFKVTNFGTNAVNVTSIRLTYTSTPQAYYEKIKFGKNFVLDYGGGTRKGSGDLITFAAQQVKGSGKPTQIVPIRVEQEQTVAPDVTIKGVGKTVTIKVQNFKDAATGSASNVSLSGVTVTVDFSDGSSNTFTVP